ncbi:MAG: hypothetical protein AB4063_11160 [Crocosphaera sp.]
MSDYLDKQAKGLMLNCKLINVMIILHTQNRQFPQRMLNFIQSGAVVQC